MFRNSMGVISRDTVARLRGDRRGVAAVEFAIFAQILALIFAGVADIALILYDRFQLNDALASAANLAMVSQASVSSAGGAALATSLGGVIANAVGGNFADAAVTVNNGPARTVTGGAGASSGTAANADQCYCPTGTPVVWGSAVACGTACGGGLLAGKFVSLRASRAHTVLFAGYGIVHNGTITVTTLVQTE